MMIGHISAAALLLAQAAPAPAPAAPPRPCVTPAEAGAMAVLVLPELIDAVGRSCTPHLAETAWLRAQGGELTQRWRTEGAGQRETALAAIAKMIPPGAMGGGPGGRGASGAGAVPPGQTSGAAPSPEAAMGAMIGGMTGEMSRRLTPATCNEISRFVESLSPLPAANVAQMVSAVMGIGVAMTPPDQQGGPPICRT